MLKLTDELLYRLANSRDASIYEYIPELVAKVDSNLDINELIKYAKDNQKSITFRGGGTSLSGQSITNSILCDLRNSFKEILIIDEGKKVKVEPSVLGGSLNNKLKKYGRKFGPDPASINYATIGGILANNSSGLSSGIKHNPYNTLSSMEFTLACGNTYNSADNQSNSKLKTENPNIFNKILDIKYKLENSSKLRAKIVEKYKLKNTIGYSLNSFLDYDTPIDILSHLFVGSEGTLGFINSAIFNTVELKSNKVTLFIIFDELKLIVEAIKLLIEQDADVIEFMDSYSLKSVESKLRKYYNSSIDNKYALLVEFAFQTNEELLENEQRILSIFNSLESSFKLNTYKQSEQIELWSIRKGLLTSIGGSREKNTGILIEDIAIRLEDLESGLIDIRSLIDKYGFETGIYGHGKDVNIHFTIAEHFHQQNKYDRIKSFFEEFTDLIINKYDGSLKAEHGTGRNMSPFVEKQWGKELYKIMCEIKETIDPNYMFNNGVMINSDKSVHLRNLKEIVEVDTIIDKCIECGYCESICPSNNHTITPRQRISISRQLNSGKYNIDEKLLNYNLDTTCATDGLCSMNCPVGINTGKYIKELRLKTPKPDFISLVSFSIIENVTKWALLINSKFSLHKVIFNSSKLNKSALSIIKPYSHRLHIHSKNSSYYYFPSCTNRIFNSSNLSEVNNMLNNLDIKIEQIGKLSNECCGLFYESKGYTNKLNENNANISSILDSYRDKPIIVDSGSCINFLKSKHNNNFVELWQVIFNKINSNIDLYGKLKDKTIYLHYNCGSRLSNTVETQFNNLNITYSEPYCCGAAGDKFIIDKEFVSSAFNNYSYDLGNYDYYISTNLTCGINISSHSGKVFLSIWEFLNLIFDK